jgi:serine/threonine protein kinase
MQKYELVKDLGTGSYGKVSLMKNTRTGEQVAIKEIPLANLTPQLRDKAQQEVNLLRSLDHPNIVRL